MTRNKKTNREINPDIIELALRWVNDEITLADVTRALDSVNASHSYTTLARALKQHLQK
jgi:hypothetical protein